MTRILYDPVAYEKALLKGKEQGIKEGIKQVKYMVAKKLLIKGQGIDTIVDVTKLSREEVENLIKEMKNK